MSHRMFALAAICVPMWAGAAEPETQIEPRAHEQLQKMSSYLAGLKSFRANATTVDEKVATDGQKIQVLKESKLAVKRPNGLRVDRIGPFGHVVFRYDGKQFSLLAADKNEYAVAKAPPNLDAAVDDARDRLGIDAPGGDLLVSDVYHDLSDGIQTARYIGLEPIGGQMAHHLAVTKKDVDWQIWIQDGPQPVPLRYVITTKDLPGRPQFTIELRDWQPNAEVAESQFAFAPPPNSRRIELKGGKQ